MSTSEDVVRAYFDALNERDYDRAALLEQLGLTDVL
jgi:hypothetical protein